MKQKKNNKDNKKIVIIISHIIVIIIIALLILSKINKVTSKLSYEITYNGINCPTPYVVFYSDGTYKYYEHYGIDEKSPEPSTGKYEYDMNKLIKNINNYEEDERGPYTIKISTQQEYITYSTNKELRELLDKNNIVLEKCMTSEDE